MTDELGMLEIADMAIPPLYAMGFPLFHPPIALKGAFERIKQWETHFPLISREKWIRQYYLNNDNTF